MVGSIDEQTGRLVCDVLGADGVGSHGADAAAGSAPNRLFGFEGPEKMVLRSADGNVSPEGCQFVRSDPFHGSLCRRE